MPGEFNNPLLPDGEIFGREIEEIRKFEGHGLGFELEELPVIGSEDKIIIRENMTFSIEINMIIPNLGAIKIEETIAVTLTHLPLCTA